MTAPGQRSQRGECSCPPGCVYCAKTGTCECPENHAPFSDIEEKPQTIREKFEHFCELNAGHEECRIYED